MLTLAPVDAEFVVNDKTVLTQFNSLGSEQLICERSTVLSMRNSFGTQLFLYLFNSFFQAQLICQALNSTLNTQ